MIPIGTKGSLSVIVSEENTAAHLKSGLLPVFATPALVALMEQTCAESVQPLLDDGMGTVGSAIDCRHTSPSPVGSRIACTSELVEADGRRLVFSVRAEDEGGVVGEARHERFIIDNTKFLEKVEKKRALLG